MAKDIYDPQSYVWDRKGKHSRDVVGFSITGNIMTIDYNLFTIYGVRQTDSVYVDVGLEYLKKFNILGKIKCRSI
jgi:hypothetical protein